MRTCTLFVLAITLFAQGPDTSARRLNRYEYDATARDLLAIPFQPAADFPLDDSGYGFDNIAGVLSLSPALMEKSSPPPRKSPEPPSSRPSRPSPPSSAMPRATSISKSILKATTTS